MKTWYEIKAKGKDAAEIIIFEEIGFFGITAKRFIEELKGLGALKQLTVRINSIGGDVFDGIAIYNVLARLEAYVTIVIDGVAASIASVVAMAGKKIIMPENSLLMIHNPWGVVAGDAQEMRDFADTMDKIKTAILAAYRAKSGQPDEKIAEMMTAETWLSAQEAKDLGFADEVAAPIQIAARASLENFKNLPASLRARLHPDPVPEPQPTPAPPAGPTADELRAAGRKEAESRAREIFAACKEFGIPELAVDFMEAELTMEQVKARLKDARNIKDMCAAAHMIERAPGWIKAGLTIKECRQKLFQLRVALDAGEIDNKLGPEVSGMNGKRQPVFSASEIYAARRQRESGKARM